MYEFVLMNFRDRFGIMSKCPHCGAQRVGAILHVCDECYEPLPNAVNIFNSVKTRIACYKDEPPWEY